MRMEDLLSLRVSEIAEQVFVDRSNPRASWRTRLGSTGSDVRADEEVQRFYRAVYIGDLGTIPAQPWFHHFFQFKAAYELARTNAHRSSKDVTRNAFVIMGANLQGMPDTRVSTSLPPVKYWENQDHIKAAVEHATSTGLRKTVAGITYIDEIALNDDLCYFSANGISAFGKLHHCHEPETLMMEIVAHVFHSTSKILEIRGRCPTSDSMDDTLDYVIPVGKAQLHRPHIMRKETHPDQIEMLKLNWFDSQYHLAFTCPKDMFFDNSNYYFHPQRRVQLFLK